MDCSSSRVIRLVELKLDHCANTNGQAPCEATELCYNTPSTCRDFCNYACGTKSLWLSDCQLPTSFGFDSVPNLIDWDETPPVADDGDVFSERGAITLTFADHAYNDRELDPYQARRYGTIPICHTDVPGTFWGRLRARHKNLRERMICFWTGPEDGEFPADFHQNQYIISDVRWTGERFIIEALDILWIADEEFSGCPRQENYQPINADFPQPLFVANELASDYVRPSPNTQFILSSTYPQGELPQDLTVVCVGTEIMQVRVFDLKPFDPDSEQVIVLWHGFLNDQDPRGVAGTQVGSHSVGADIVIPMVFRQGEHVAEAVRRLMLECVRIDEVMQRCCVDTGESALCLESLNEYRECYPGDLIGKDVYLCDPEQGVRELLNELATDYQFAVFVDQRTGKIVMRKIATPPCDVPALEECDIIGDPEMTTEIDRQASVTIVDYCPQDASRPVGTDNKLFTLVYATEDAVLEPCARLEYPTIREDRRGSRWYHPRVQYLIDLNLRRRAEWRRCEPILVALQVDRNAWPADLWLLDYFTIDHTAPGFQGENGTGSGNLWLLRSAKLSRDGKCYEITARSTPYLGRYRYTSRIDCDRPECSLQMTQTEPYETCRFPACDTLVA